MHVDLNILTVLGSNSYFKKKTECEFKTLLVSLVSPADIY